MSAPRWPHELCYQGDDTIQKPLFNQTISHKYSSSKFYFQQNTTIKQQKFMALSLKHCCIRLVVTREAIRLIKLARHTRNSSSGPDQYHACWYIESLNCHVIFGYSIHSWKENKFISLIRNDFNCLGISKWNVCMYPYFISSRHTGEAQLSAVLISRKDMQIYHDDVIKWKHFRVTGGFPSRRPVTRIFDVFFDLYPNKRLSKQSNRWWFETPSRSL